jgi:Tol biopolymer transport system component
MPGRRPQSPSCWGELRQITPPGMNFNFSNGSWSPQGNEILFSARVPDSQYASTIWVEHSDGSGLRQIPVPGCGGLLSSSTFIGCGGSPSWSPDGKKIVFSRLVGATGQRDLYTVNADGSGLFQVTHTPDIAEDYAGDWGTHPVTP